MRSSVYFISSGIVFIFAAILHFVRLSFGLDLVIGSWLAPVWLSGAVVVIAGILGIWSFKHAVRQDEIALTPNTPMMKETAEDDMANDSEGGNESA